ncbi:putative NUDIX family NTP pyrophosphohydrolase [Saccharothrix saharensis]|uniref:Putative NUDIX family NTP pyrophosphohydrolase n=1 Tax=Saccharothrix saharensis TaxID=571190 RepID=A0A543J5K1_9PSEU|nr:NUDIX domain-containing protein [Saccharothrix saharensis]TQM78114.1 putative NUDIX family NTP pyrophosphohydrolase [Saccharothrix saharensis]
MTGGRRSAGILLHRVVDGGRQVLLGHMGGPFWARKDDGAWSIPKGEPDGDEEPEATARREFTEELGVPVPEGELVPLGEVRQSGGKVVTAWALAADLDPDQVIPGTFTLEWPRGSGTVREFPEVDRVAWFPLAEARVKVVKAQRELLDRLAEMHSFE